MDLGQLVAATLNRLMATAESGASRRNKSAFKTAHSIGTCTRCARLCWGDLDHRDGTIKATNNSGKTLQPSDLIEYGFARLKAELGKCDLKCAECHRLKNYCTDNGLEVPRFRSMEADLLFVLRAQERLLAA